MTEHPGGRERIAAMPHESPQDSQARHVSELAALTAAPCVWLAGGGLRPAPARAEQQIDGIGRIAGPEHPFAGRQRAELKPRPPDELKRLAARAAHQRRTGNLVWQRLVHSHPYLDRRDESVIDFPHPDQRRGRGRGKAHDQKHTY